jgi:hypothetical protein
VNLTITFSSRLAIHIPVIAIASHTGRGLLRSP